MATVTAYPHIDIRADGLAWIANTQIKVLEVVLDKRAHGWNARPCLLRCVSGFGAAEPFRVRQSNGCLGARQSHQNFHGGFQAGSHRSEADAGSFSGRRHRTVFRRGHKVIAIGKWLRRLAAPERTPIGVPVVKSDRHGVCVLDALPG